MSAPSLFQIVKTDQISMFAALAGPICLVMGGLCTVGWLPDLRNRFDSWFIEQDDAPIFVAMAAIGFAIGAVVLVWRALRIRRAFESGHQVPGKVTKLTLFRGRGYLHYAYTVADQPVQTLQFVVQTRSVKALVVGQQVNVAVDRNHPKAGFVADIFQAPASTGNGSQSR
jgi:hypothetical protein